jgi:hypothetical protein
MTDDLMSLIKASIAAMIEKEVTNQIEDIRTDDTVLSSEQVSEVDTMIRDVINQELTVSV